MEHLGARTSDWHSDNPKIRPGTWIVPIILAVLVVISLVALMGHYINGDGSPFLSQPGSDQIRVEQ
jgi:hypothetical protein